MAIVRIIKVKIVKVVVIAVFGISQIVLKNCVEITAVDGIKIKRLCRHDYGGNGIEFTLCLMV